MNFKTKMCLTASALALTAHTSAFAQPPHRPDLVNDGNRWTITAYNDSSPVHTQWATQGLCFYFNGVVGTHQRYIWVSDTYPDWNGRATQEGDQIFMHGDFQWPFGNKDGGHDGMEWAIVTASRANEGAGHWKEWIEDGGFGVTIGFANAKLQRVGKCKYQTAEEALAAGYDLEFPKDDQGNFLRNPFGVSPDKVK
ncbi:MAG: hypothetical protein KZQ99_02015 [Candidatus Thiodiazotropha sp. (ex Dulcina madagascariensis)]|nr:hypothetical protein [Candidatus Thiodiazotropha sp. (ex Dulcina madagascariensis)]